MSNQDDADKAPGQHGEPPQDAYADAHAGTFGMPSQNGTVPLEHYLRLDAHIERLRADQRPDSPGRLSREDAQAYQMAALFRSAAPGADDPDPSFVANLRARLHHELERASQQSSLESPSPRTAEPRADRQANTRTGAQTGSSQAAADAPDAPRPSRLTRRWVLAGGLGAAAALAGIATGAGVERAITTQPNTAGVPLVIDGQGKWVAVAKAAELPVGAVKWFATDSIVGFLRNTGNGIAALSGVCTHMGCLLQWNQGQQTFDCPCHGGRFNADGTSAPSSPVQYQPLPKLETKVEQDQIWVYVASSPSPGGTSSPAPSTPDAPYGDRAS